MNALIIATLATVWVATLLVGLNLVGNKETEARGYFLLAACVFSAFYALAKALGL